MFGQKQQDQYIKSTEHYIEVAGWNNKNKKWYVNERTQTIPNQTNSNCLSRNYSWWVTEPEAHLKLATDSSNAHAPFPEKFLKTKYTRQQATGWRKQIKTNFFTVTPKKKKDQAWYWKHPEQIQTNLKGFPCKICKIWRIRTWDLTEIEESESSSEFSSC